MKLRNVELAAALLGACVIVGACGTSEQRVLVEPEQPPPLASADASAPEASIEGLITYCPSSACPPGWTTCPNSRFPCDTNVRADSSNCGACGVVCPKGSGRESYVCVEGECTMKCFDGYLDCDGLPDNGCEATPSSRESCGGCGIRCDDPEKPCIGETLDAPHECGCPDGKKACGTRCIDVDNDDQNCSACSVACDRTGPGLPERPNAFYGCGKAECGHIKCSEGFGDCDGDPENGCETPIPTKANCGACGNACADDEECRLGENDVPQCMCAPGFTLCGPPCPEGSVCPGACADLTSDRYNCGACGATCSPFVSNAFSSCNYGTCTYGCNQGWADCNDSSSDGCETNTASDPNNCGGCGITCDLLLGQACVAGRCVVEPCSDLERDAGELAR